MDNSKKSASDASVGPVELILASVSPAFGWLPLLLGIGRAETSAQCSSVRTLVPSSPAKPATPTAQANIWASAA